MAVAPQLPVPDAIILRRPDGTTSTFPLLYPPECKGFVFSYRMDDAVGLTYECYAQMDEPEEKGTSDDPDRR